jgi:thiaminase/transcriptional activator TenA
MRSPRRITLDEELAVKHGISFDPPPPDSLFWSMWNACVAIAQRALGTPFIQGIKAGTLDPVKYGGFNVSDAYYCFHAAKDYPAAERRATDSTLKAFLLRKYHAYQKYNATFPPVWHVKDAQCIAPLDVCKEYSRFESSVAANEDPIYCLVVMLPCEYLWAWLAAQLGTPSPQNLYASWITENVGAQGAYAIGNYLSAYQTQHPGAIDAAKATDIYRRAMEFEHRNFAAATSTD